MPCEKLNQMCTRGHRCRKLCFESCSEPCSEENVHVLNCGHEKKALCSSNINTLECDQPCEKLNQSCSKGHRCQKLCSQECGPCLVEETFLLNCGHEMMAPCSSNVATLRCRRPCEKLNQNCTKGHICMKMCSEVCGPCLVEETFLLTCGHDMKAPCSSNVDTLKCRERCKKICENCNMRCEKRCSDSCFPCKNEVITDF